MHRLAALDVERGEGSPNIVVTLLVCITVMATSEVWANAPLALVALEARFPAPSTSPVRPPVQRAIRDRLGSGWVIEGGTQQTVEFAVGPGAASAPNIRTEDMTRITVRDRTRAVTVRPESLTVEATTYNGYADFRALLAAAFSAVEDVLEPDGLTRLGLRYIDEVRVPTEDGVADWASWMTPALLAPQADAFEPQVWSGAARYSTGEGRWLVLRYGPSEGPLVDPAGPLKRPRRPLAGPIFGLDFDSYWQPDTIPAFSTPELLAAVDVLRGPARSMFDQLMTPRLVDEVFRRDP